MKKRPFVVKKGSILIVVLWVLFFLAGLALVIRAYLFSQLDVAAKVVNRTKAYYLAKAGMRRAAWELLLDESLAYDVLKENWSSNQEAFRGISLGEGTYSVFKESIVGKNDNEIACGMIDEGAKVNINKVGYAVLVNFFSVVGETASSRAEIIADSVIDWRDEDNDVSVNGAEDEYYFLQNPSYSCKNHDFEFLEELLFVRGVDRELFDRVKPYLTLYGEGKVNVNTAPRVVLQGVGLGDSLSDKIIDFRAGKDGREGTEDDNIFENEGTIGSTLTREQGVTPEENSQLSNIIGLDILAVKSRYFRGFAVGRLTGREDFRQIEFVIDRDSGIKYWRED